MPHTHVKAAMAWLDDSPEFRLAVQHADTLLRIQSTLAELRPDLRLSAISLKDQVLTLGTLNAATAARCRQLEPSIRESLIRFWPEVNRIRFSPQRIDTVPDRRSDRSRDIPSEGLSELAGLQARLEPSPLQDAVRRLVNRHKARTGKHQT